MNILENLQKIIPDHPWEAGDNIAFKIGDFVVAWYGIFIGIGFLTAIMLAVVKAWKWYKIPTDPIYWYCVMLIPVAIIGARLWSYIIGDAKDWSNFFGFGGGDEQGISGLAIEGGVTLSVIVAVLWFPWYLKRPSQQIRDEFGGKVAVRQVSMWVYADCCLPAILIGQVIGRWGNYFNQELYGAIITNEWYQHFLNKVLPWMYINQEWRQPLFLYEGILNFIGFASIFIGAEFISKRKCGDLGLAYFTWYGMVRLSLEGLREHEYTFALSYVMSALWVAAGITIMIGNHLLFSRTREYKIKTMISAFIKRSFHIAIQNIKIPFVKKDENKLQNIKREISQQKEIYAHRKKDFKRTYNEMLYYRGY